MKVREMKAMLVRAFDLLAFAIEERKNEGPSNARSVAYTFRLTPSHFIEDSEERVTAS